MRKTTSLLLVGSLLTLALPFASQAAPAGHFIKGSGDTIYWLGTDNKRYVFPDEATLQSWLSQTETQGEILAPEILATYPLGGAMTVRPGTFMVRFSSAPTKYVISHGAILHTVTDEQAAAYYGVDWSKKIETLDVALFANYQVGQPLLFMSDYDAAREASAAATPDVENANKLAVGTLTKSPTPFTGTVTFTQAPSMTSSTVTMLVTVTKTNAPIGNLRINIYNESGAFQTSCLSTDHCGLTIDETDAKTDAKVRAYAIVSNERGETLEKTYSPYVILTPPSSIPQM